MNNTLTMIAAALSLTSVGEYRHVDWWPADATNLIRGVGMGRAGDSRAVRLEDAAFVWEAVCERAWRIGAEWAVVTNGAVTTLPRGAALRGWGFEAPTWVWAMWPESFETPLGLEIFARGARESYVSGSFALGPSDGGTDFLETAAGWTVPGMPSLGSIRDSYVPLIREGYARLTPPALVTNVSTSAGGPLRRGAVMGLYTNVTLCARAVSPRMSWARDEGGRHGVLRETLTRGRTADFSYADYTVPDGRGGTVAKRTATGYSLADDPEGRSAYGTDAGGVVPEERGFVSHWAFTHEAYTQNPSDVWWTGPTNWSGVSAMAPFVSGETLTFQRITNSPTVRAVCDLLGTNDAAYVSGVRAVTVAGLVRTAETIRRKAVYGGWEETRTAETNWMVAVRSEAAEETGEVTATSPARPGRTAKVWGTTVRLGEILAGAAAAWGEPEDYFDAETPQPLGGDYSTLPTSGGAVPSLGASAEIRGRSVRCEWLRVVFVFDCDWRAKELE